MKKRTLIISSLALGLLVASSVFFYACRDKSQRYTIETAKVSRGNVKTTVTATGTLQALKTVEVGTQVSGVISKLHADYNSYVTKGQLLAELDKTPLLATLSNAQASLDDSKAELTYKTANYNRVKALYDKNLVAQTDFDEALYYYSKAQASTKIAQSNYDKAKINLDYATVYSPIDGVVLSREVSEGQTVAASFSAPTLFKIANDLTQMQVEANIDEADIGQVKVNQRVEFTVDAFPDEKFEGKVSEIRLQSTTTSNVVTYTVIVSAHNPEKKLMPGMTANISIFVLEAENVLTVPVKATQFKADSATVTGYMNSLPEGDRPKLEMPKGEGKPKGMPASGLEMGAKPASSVWVKSQKVIHPVPVETGVSDGVNIEIKSGLNDGDEVIINMSAAGTETTKAATSGSPFMPKPPQDKSKSAKK